MHPISSANSPEALERLARRRAGAKMGWFIHALFYVCVNAGLGLAIHGLAVWLGSGMDLHQRLLQTERDKLQRQRGAP